jgi:8-oxo-dGTP diphosphatase
MERIPEYIESVCDIWRYDRMQLLYGTGNVAKLEAMKRRLQDLNIEIIGLQEIKQEAVKAPEKGNTPLENARQKALWYYEQFKMPVFSCDSGLYIEGIPQELQPGVYVRTINRVSMIDEEMLDYYSGLAKQYGDLTARYHNASV